MPTADEYTIREHIFEEIKTLLEDVEGVEKVEIERSTPVDIETIPFATCFVYAGRETRVTNSDPEIKTIIGSETWGLEVVIEVWSYADDCETLLGRIHQEMFDKYTLNGYAIMCRRMGVNKWTINTDRGLKSMLISYLVHYRHKQGDPYTLTLQT